jgi:Uma2 family endonuclease
MVVAPVTLKLTYEDFLGFPEDGKRHELLDGDHFVTPAPNLRHQRLVVRLTRVLDSFIDRHGLGWLYTSPVDIVLSDFDVVEPDLVFLSRQRGHLRADTHLAGAPDLVIEILSDSTRKRDEITKRHLYERHGVAEYWIVDPVLETVKVYRRQGERFAAAELFERAEGGQLDTALLPGFELALDELFGE